MNERESALSRMPPPHVKLTLLDTHSHTLQRLFVLEFVRFG